MLFVRVGSFQSLDCVRFVPRAVFIICKKVKRMTNRELQTTHFIEDEEERQTTISALFTLIGHAAHSNSGALEEEERKAISWLNYFLQCLVEDDRALITKTVA